MKNDKDVRAKNNNNNKGKLSKVLSTKSLSKRAN